MNGLNLFRTPTIGGFEKNDTGKSKQRLYNGTLAGQGTGSGPGDLQTVIGRRGVGGEVGDDHVHRIGGASFGHDAGRRPDTAQVGRDAGPSTTVEEVGGAQQGEDDVRGVGVAGKTDAQPAGRQIDGERRE